MNQPNAPIIATRAAMAVEGPDVVAIVRRYAWLLIAGTAVGAAVATGLHFYILRNEPRYTASIPFQVLPPPTPIGGESASSVVVSNIDDTSAFIHRQMLILSQEPILNEIIRSDEFHKRQEGSGDSLWLTEYKSNPIKRLKKDLIVTPRVNAGAFEISMTAKDKFEAWNLVQAAVKVYRSKLKRDSSDQSSKRLEGLNLALTKQEDDFKAASDELQLYAKSHNVDAARSRLNVEQASLQGLNQDWTKAEAMASSAEAESVSLKKQVEDLNERNKKHKENKDTQIVNGVERLVVEELKFTPEMVQFMENDYQVQNLKLQRNNLIIEQAGIESQTATSSSVRKADIEARIKKVDDRLADRHEELLVLAGAKMLETAEQDASKARTLADIIGKTRTTKEGLVLDIGNQLMLYNLRVDNLHEKQLLLNDINKQYKLAELNRSTDDIRAQQMISEPAVPTEVAWPQWYTFIPLGTAGGLGLSFLLAYLLVLTDTRVRTPRDITRTLQLSLLGFVPDERDDRTLGGNVETAIITSPASMVAESFRQIRSHVTAQTAHSPVNTLLVASIAPGGGATTVASNLAAAMALNGLRVLLVDANFYRPGLRKVFSGIPVSGFADAIADPDDLSASISSHPNVPKLHFLGAGSALQGASSEMFEGKAFRDLLENLKSKYDLIIFDGAPLNLVSDSLALASRVDGVICVVRAGEVSRGTVSRVRDQLRGVHSNLLGFVLNAAQTSSVGYFKENYKTFYRYAGKGAPRQATVS